MALAQDSGLEEKIARSAWEVRRNAHAPWSGFPVGAALWLPGPGEIVCGVNVENASYGATICAERAAVMAAVSRFGKVDIGLVAVATDAAEPAVPCALCLQVLAEFCTPTVEVLLVNAGGIQARYRFAELLPHPFKDF